MNNYIFYDDYKFLLPKNMIKVNFNKNQEFVRRGYISPYNKTSKGYVYKIKNTDTNKYYTIKLNHRIIKLIKKQIQEEELNIFVNNNYIKHINANLVDSELLGWGNNYDVNIINIKYFDEKHSIDIPCNIEEFISGPTLETAINNEIFFNCEIMKKEFINLINKFLKVKFFPGDFKPPNIMWNPENNSWIVVDFNTLIQHYNDSSEPFCYNTTPNYTPPCIGMKVFNDSRKENIKIIINSIRYTYVFDSKGKHFNDSGNKHLNLEQQKQLKNFLIDNLK